MTPNPRVRRLLAALAVAVFAIGGAVAILRTSTAVLAEDETSWCLFSDEQGRQDLGGGPAPAISFPATNLDVIVELALGADLTKDPNTWTWTDISTYVRHAERLVIHRGRGDEWTLVGPGQVTLTLDNRDGRFTRVNPVGAYYGQLRRNTPLRVRVDLHQGAGPQTRFTGYVTKWPPRWDKSGNNKWAPISADGIFRRLGQGDPLHSALFRTILGSTPLPHAYWPMEDKAGTTQFASALLGGKALVGGGITFIESEPNTVTAAAESTLPGSLPVPVFNAASSLTGQIPAYGDNGQWVWFQMVRMPSANNGQTVQDVVTLRTNSATLPDTVISLNLSAYQLVVKTFNPNGVQVDTITDLIDGGSAAVLNQWLLLAVASKDGADTLTARLFDLNGTEIANASGTVDAAFHSTMHGFILRAPSGSHAAAQGHAGLYTSAGFTAGTDEAQIARAAGGHVGEQAHARIKRLCDEDKVPVAITGTSSAAMGAQSTDTLLNLLRQSESTDLGVLYETLDGRVGYRTNTDRYNRDPALTLDYNSGQITDPWAPEDDDQRIRNDITVTRPSGSSARDEDATSIADEGRYKQPHTANVEKDSQLADTAGWLKHLGIWDELRFPQAGVKLHRHTSLISKWLAFDVLTHRLDIVNLPSPVPAATLQTTEGYTEIIGSRDWEIAFNLVPYGTYRVALLDDVILGKLDSGSSTLTSAITSGATSFSVNTTVAADLWTTDAAEMPIPLMVAGEEMSVTAISGASSPQTFTVTRSVNGVVKAHSAGAQVHVRNAARLAL